MFTLTNIRQELDQVREKSSAEEFSFSKNSFDIDKVDANRVYHITQIKKSVLITDSAFWMLHYLKVNFL